MALPIVASLGALGTLIATVTPFFTKKAITDPSAGVMSNLLNRVGFSGINVATIQSQEDKIIEDLDKKYIKMTETLRRALYTKYMVDTYIPNALKTRAEGKITDIDDIYNKLEAFKQDEFMKDLIFDKFANFLKYRKPYLRIMDNFLAQFKRLKSLKDQIQKIYDSASKINMQKLDIEPDQEKIKGGDFPVFIKSEIALLYEEFTRGYEDYMQYRDRLSNFFKLIRQQSFDELDVFAVAKTDISAYTGEDKGIMLWSTEQNVEEANKIIDKLEANRINTSICLSTISNSIQQWLNQLKSSKNLVVISIRGILEKEKDQIKSLTDDNINNIADLEAVKQRLVEIKAKDKLDDAKLELSNLKTKDKKYESIISNIKTFEARMKSYEQTINNSGDIVKVVYTPCNLSSTSSSVVSPSTSATSAIYSSSATSTSSTSAIAGTSDEISSKLNSINFANAENKEEAQANIDKLSNIFDIDLPDFYNKVKEDYEMIKIVNQIIAKNKDKGLFGNLAQLYGVPNNKPINDTIEKTLKS